MMLRASLVGIGATTAGLGAAAIIRLAGGGEWAQLAAYAIAIPLALRNHPQRTLTVA